MSANTEKLKKWSKRLLIILNEADRVLKNGGDIEPIKSRLDKFIEDSPPLADELDITAELTAIALNSSSGQEARATIVTRKKTLESLLEQLSGVTAEASRDAESIRLTKITEAIDAGTAVVRSFSDLRKNIETLDDGSDPDVRKLTADLKKMVDSVINLKGRIEKFGNS